MTLKWRIHSSNTDHATLLEQIDAEWDDVGIEFPNTRLTRSWILQKSLIEGAHAYHIRDIVWAFPYETKAAFVVVVERGLKFVMSDGTDAGFAVGGAQDADAVLRYIAERAPWAVIGFDSDVEGLYLLDAGAFIADVLEKRARFERGEAAPGDDEPLWCPYCSAPVLLDARFCPHCDGPLQEDEDQVDA